MADVADVFISYHIASASNVVQRIDAELRRRGISCWYTEKDFAPGEDFARAVPREIAACRVFLLILDRGASRSPHVENEWGLAFRQKSVDIILFQVEKGFTSKWVDYCLVHTQRIDGTVPPIDDRIREVVDRIEEIVGVSKPRTTSEPLPIERKSPFGKKRREEQKEAERQKRELRKTQEELRRAKKEVERLREELRRRKNV